MEIDIILILMYLALAAALVAVVWSKVRSWQKTVLLSTVLAAVVGVCAWILPGFIDSDDQSGVWNIVAYVFLALIALFLGVAVLCVVWSMLKRKRG